MSVEFFLVALVCAVGALMLMILRFKVHPVLAIFLCALGLGIALGNSPLETVELINAGFGKTLTGIGIVIILGSIIAMGVQDTGAAISIANFFAKLFKGKNVDLGPSLSAFILSIPVFGDITMILLSPIANTLAHAKKMSMSRMASFIGLGLFLTHALVPPTPGVLAVTLHLGADLGLVIFWGFIVSLIAFFVTWFILRDWTEKEFIPPAPEFTESDASGTPNVTPPSWLPSVGMAMLPLLMPVILISLASFGKAYLPKDSTLLVFLQFVGDRVIALGIGVIFTLALVFGRETHVHAAAVGHDTSINASSPLSELLLGSWVKRALIAAVVPLLVTAMGGAFGSILSSAPAAKELAGIIAKSNIIPIFIPWIVGAAMMTCVGSMTMAQLTAAALIAPIIPNLGISPLAAVLSSCSGVLMGNHVNNSGFWVMCGFYNMNPRQGFKYVTLPCAIGSVIAIICIAAFNSMGFLG